LVKIHEFATSLKFIFKIIKTYLQENYL